MSEQSSLNDLLIDEEEFNEELLVETLENFIRIGKNEGNLYPRTAFRDLNSQQQVCVVLLSQHAREQLGMAETQWLKPGDISELGGINVNTVYPSVRELDEKGLIEGDDGSYRVSPAKINDISRFINGTEK